jgi:hypothetical protein
MNMDDDWEPDDSYWDAKYEYEAELVEKAIADLHDDQVRDHLGKFGDAVQERVDACIQQSQQFAADGHPSLSLVLSVTATELVIHHLILRPILGGAFLSEQWAEVLVKRILSQRSASDRELLPAVLKTWDIDLNALKLADGKPLWQTFVNQVVPKRNAVVHQGAQVHETMSKLSLEAHRAFAQEIVAKLSDRLGFSWSATHRWSETKQGVGGAKSSTRFSPASPFGD